VEFGSQHLFTRRWQSTDWQQKLVEIYWRQSIKVENLPFALPSVSPSTGVLLL
jgi:hypothetical protein